jgi:hypothetical protein
MKLNQQIPILQRWQQTKLARLINRSDRAKIGPFGNPVTLIVLFALLGSMILLFSQSSLSSGISEVLFGVSLFVIFFVVTILYLSASEGATAMPKELSLEEKHYTGTA